MPGLIATIFGTILLFYSCLGVAQPIQTGATQTAHYLPLLTGKRVGLVVNQTSLVDDTHLVDYLLAHKVAVKVIFSPEHGFRGDKDAGQIIKHSVDSQTGIKIHSIYGKNKKPPTSLMQDLDIIIFDIQDVGLRYYTYLSSMHYVMEAAAESGTQFMVFDRPNPNGRFVDGPILQPAFSSFVGLHPIPILHGMTLAELARMIKGEKWINQAEALDLVVVAMRYYRREMHYSLPVKPSPNLPNDQAISLYPALCFFEATPVSIGRGTDFPFQVAGHDSVQLGSFAFTPISRPGAALHPKLMNKKLKGADLRDADWQGLDLKFFDLAYRQFKGAGITFFERPSFMDKLAGTDDLRLQMEAGVSLEDIRQSWQTGLQLFRQKRKPYLLYPDYELVSAP